MIALLLVIAIINGSNSQSQDPKLRNF